MRKATKLEKIAIALKVGYGIGGLIMIVGMLVSHSMFWMFMFLPMFYLLWILVKVEQKIKAGKPAENPYPYHIMD